MILETKKMYELQQILQDHIVNEHGIPFEESKHLRILALLVEVGECANETRSFKYWSNKTSSPKEVVLEEFVDGIHFLLAIGIDHNFTPDSISFEKSEESDVSKQFLRVYHSITELIDHFSEETYLYSFRSYLQLLPLLKIDVNEVYDAYVLKNKENHHRQEIKY